MADYERVNRRTEHKGAIVEMCTDTIKLPNGKCVDWDIVLHKGAAAIIPVDNEGNVYLVEQYRNGPEKKILEIPAGCRDEGEDFYDCAKRELEEEIGYCARRIEPLLEIYTTVAFCNEKIGIFYGEDLVPSTQHLDEDEFVEIKKYPLQKVVDMIFDGTIQDSKTVAAILAYKTKKGL